MTTQQRWYDAYPGIEQSLKAFDSFPAEILEILLEGLAEVTEAKGCESEVLKALKTLGSQKTIPLQKSQAKRRSYDKSLQLHQTMNRLFLLGDNSREVIAEKMMGLIQVVIEYFKLCRQCNTPPLVEDLEALTGFYARRGDLWARHFLKNLRRDLETRAKSKGVKTHRGSQDPYRLLGVGISATPQEIKAAYRRLARQYHPDVNPRSEEHFKEINDAYQKLLDLKTKVPTKGC